MDFAERVKFLRDEVNISQAELASRLHISCGTVGNWETGNRVPRGELLEAVADFFNVDIDYLLGHTNERPEYNLEETFIIKLYRLADECDKDAIKAILRKYDVSLKQEESSSSVG